MQSFLKKLFGIKPKVDPAGHWPWPTPKSQPADVETTPEPANTTPAKRKPVKKPMAKPVATDTATTAKRKPRKPKAKKSQ